MIRDIEIRAERPSLEEAQAIVGGFIEIVIDDGEKQLIVNEEGLLLGLPFNETASRMMNEFTTYDMPTALASFVKGETVFVCHPDDDDVPMLSEKDIKDSDGHLFVLKTGRHIVGPALLLAGEAMLD